MITRTWRRWEKSQALVILPIVLLLAGSAGLVLGSEAARSFGNLGGDVAVRITGAIMVVGGATVLVGIGRRKAAVELAGFCIGAFGAALYGMGTLIGFGTGGIMSGLGWLGIAGVLVERIIFALGRAVARRRIESGR